MIFYPYYLSYLYEDQCEEDFINDEDEPLLLRVKDLFHLITALVISCGAAACFGFLVHTLLKVLFK